MWTSQKSLLKKIPKARKGKPSIGLQNFVNRLNKVSSAAFMDELQKIAVSTRAIEREIKKDQATEAIRTLREDKPQRHLEAALVSGTLGPGSMAASRAAKALVDAKSGGRGKALKGSLKAITRGDVAQAAVGYGLTGAGISYGRSRVGQARARKFLNTVGLKRYTGDREKKSMKLPGVVPPPKAPPAPSVVKAPKVLPKARPAINPYKTVHQTMKPSRYK